jgi:hypothetical protein
MVRREGREEHSPERGEMEGSHFCSFSIRAYYECCVLTSHCRPKERKVLMVIVYAGVHRFMYRRYESHLYWKLSQQRISPSVRERRRKTEHGDKREKLKHTSRTRRGNTEPGDERENLKHSTTLLEWKEPTSRRKNSIDNFDDPSTSPCINNLYP